jgi:hypothetical protein
LLRRHNISATYALSAEREAERALKISMEIITTVEFEIASDKYPAGMSPDRRFFRQREA